MDSQESEPNGIASRELMSFKELPFAQRRAIQLALGDSALSAMLDKITFDHQNVMYIGGKPLRSIAAGEL